MATRRTSICSGLLAAALVIAGPLAVAAQRAKSTAEDSNPEAEAAPASVGSTDEPTAQPEWIQESPATYDFELERRFNELQSEILDERGKLIDRVLMFFGIVVAVAGFLAFWRFRDIENDAKMSAESARKTLDEIKGIKQKAVIKAAEIHQLTSEDAETAPQKATDAIEDVSRNPEASPIDKAIARAVSLAAGEADAQGYRTMACNCCCRGRQ